MWQQPVQCDCLLRLEKDTRYVESCSVDKSIVFYWMWWAWSYMAWFLSYPNQINQSRCLNICSIKDKHLVPQGTISRPLFIHNDVEFVANLYRIAMYTDDTSLFYRSKYLVKLQLSFQHELHSVEQFSQFSRSVKQIQVPHVARDTSLPCQSILTGRCQQRCE